MMIARRVGKRNPELLSLGRRGGAGQDGARRCTGRQRPRGVALTARTATTKPMMVMTLLAPSEVVEHESVTGSLFKALHR